MKAETHTSPLAHAYARSLLELADERPGSSSTEVGRELNDLRIVIEADDAFRLYLSDPAISDEMRAGVIERAFKGKVSPLMYDFLRVVNHKGRFGSLPEIAKAYQQQLDEKLGKVEVDLIVAQKLSPEQVADAKRRISDALKRDAVVHVYVDENIIGGAIVRVGDKLIDASVKHQLQAMKEKLLARAPR